MLIACVSEPIPLAPAPEPTPVHAVPSSDIDLYRGGVLDLALALGAGADALAADPRTDVPAELSIEGRSWEVGVHLKGHTSFRDLDGKPSLVLDFEAWGGPRGPDGIRHLTLNNFIQDGSMLGEPAAFWFFREVGLPAPRTGWARVTIDGAPYGLYEVVESLDERWIEAHFGDARGNLYAGGYGGDFAEGRERLFELEVEGAAPWVDLETLVVELRRAEDVRDVLETRFDDILTFMAADFAIGNDDGYTSSGNNFKVWVEPSRATLLPWGWDHSFREWDPVFTGLHGALARMCVGDTACVGVLAARIREVLVTWERADLLGWATVHRDLIRADCEADPRAELACELDQERLLRWIAERPAELRAELDAAE